LDVGLDISFVVTQGYHPTRIPWKYIQPPLIQNKVYPAAETLPPDLKVRSTVDEYQVRRPDCL